jgi:predicted amino acid racemase
MFDIFDKNVIRIARGNSASINITPIDTDTGTPVILQEGDKVLFTVKNQNGATVMKKVLTSADYDDGEDTSLNCSIEPDVLSCDYPE